MQKKQIRGKKDNDDKAFEEKRAEEFRKFMKMHFGETQCEDCKKLLKLK
jgi:hypothetical protein